MALRTVFLSGDVMTGRGVDQILPHPGDPELRERHIGDARRYVELAESANGPIPRPVDFTWPWGDALRTLEDLAPDVRVINLETTITGSDDFAAGKAVHYRMSPGNLACLSALRPDVCALANNHALDFGGRGLDDTLDALAGASIRTTGAGRDERGARQPAVVPVGSQARIIILACGARSSGIPPNWAATGNESGVHLLRDLSPTTAAEIAHQVTAPKRRDDLAVVSIHWGSNWGYQVGPDQREFAHRLIDAGVDVVHGHSSHHPRPIEIYCDKLILYGCGDFVDDYEGIAGYEQYRDDLRLMYLASLEASTGRLVKLRMAPMQARHMQLHRASAVDTEWLHRTVDQLSRAGGAHVDLDADGMLVVRPT